MPTGSATFAWPSEIKGGESMNDKNNNKTDNEEKIEQIEEEIERVKQDIPFTEHIIKMQAPDPWPDPPTQSEQNGVSNSEDK